MLLEIPGHWRRKITVTGKCLGPWFYSKYVRSINLSRTFTIVGVMGAPTRQPRLHALASAILRCRTSLLADAEVALDYEEWRHNGATANAKQTVRGLGL
jgi:hypothetical protein